MANSRPLLIAGAGDLVTFARLDGWRQASAGSPYARLRQADFAVANLEVPLTGVEDPQRQGICLRSDPAIVADLAAAGIQAVSLANNHIGDQGWAGVADTARRCAEAGMVVAGIGGSPAEAFAARLVPAARWSGGRAAFDLALIAFTCIPPAPSLSGRWPGLAQVAVRTGYSLDPERLAVEPAAAARVWSEPAGPGLEALLEAVRKARRSTPLVLVMAHWGVSLQVQTTEYQRRLARRLVEAGASVVFGAHSHCLQGVEMIGSSPVFYGLGSLVFSYPGDYRRLVPPDTGIAGVEVDSASGEIRSAFLSLGRLDPAGEPAAAAEGWTEHLAELLLRASRDLEGERTYHRGALTLTRSHPL